MPYCCEVPPGASAESLEDMIDIALTECERFYPAFQFVLWGGKSPAEALARRNAGLRGRGMTAGSIPPILLVGCGRMGSAMLSGWREQGLAASFAVDPAPSAAAFAGPDMTVVTGPGAIPAQFAPAAVVLAVKPQNAAETLPAYARFAGHAVFLSIMAGRTIAGITASLAPRWLRVARLRLSAPCRTRLPRCARG